MTTEATEVKKSCGSMGGRLANLKTKGQINLVANFLWGKPFQIGLATDIPGLPSM